MSKKSGSQKTRPTRRSTCYDECLLIQLRNKYFKSCLLCFVFSLRQRVRSEQPEQTWNWQSLAKHLVEARSRLRKIWYQWEANSHSCLACTVYKETDDLLANETAFVIKGNKHLKKTEIQLVKSNLKNRRLRYFLPVLTISWVNVRTEYSSVLNIVNVPAMRWRLVCVW